MVCKRHKDHGNKEHSYILWLGDFTGGALNFDDGTIVEGKGVWHKISGHIHHWNDPPRGKQVLHCTLQGYKEAEKQVAGRGYAGEAGCRKSSSPNNSSIRASGTLYRSRASHRRLTDARCSGGPR